LTTPEDNAFHVFVDRASISRLGDIASMRSMVVYQQAEDGIAANISQDEYDCDKNQYRFVQLTFLYDDQSVWQDREDFSGEWRSIPSQSIAEAALEFACDSV
jgi:hypothetical protein